MLWCRYAAVEVGTLLKNQYGIWDKCRIKVYCNCTCQVLTLSLPRSGDGLVPFQSDRRGATELTELPVNQQGWS